MKRAGFTPYNPQRNIQDFFRRMKSGLKMPCVRSCFLGDCAGFTLIELLMTVAVIATLATAAVLLINPAEQFRRARDSQRISDLATLQIILASYINSSGMSGVGNSSVLYVSLPDPAATTPAGTACETMGLPPLPVGWTYRCAHPDYYRKADGTGWLPVDFAQLAAALSLGALPVDPINTVSSGYYTYAAKPGLELTARFESAKYVPEEYKDGGKDPALYEVGTNLSLTPFAGGLVGWWSFDEGSGTAAADGSGFGTTGNFLGPPGSPVWTPGKMGTALQFNGVQGILSIQDSPVYELRLQPPFTISEWLFKYEDTAAHYSLFKGITVSGGGGSTNDWEIFHSTPPMVVTLQAKPAAWGGACPYAPVLAQTDFPQSGIWTHFAFSYGNNIGNAYLNGGLESSRCSAALSLETSDRPLFVGGNYFSSQFDAVWNGNIDDVRIWRRALTPLEVKNIYDAAQ